MIYWDIPIEIEELEIDAIVQYAIEQYPIARPRIISENGSQFVGDYTYRPLHTAIGTLLRATCRRVIRRISTKHETKCLGTPEKLDLYLVRIKLSKGS